MLTRTDGQNPEYQTQHGVRLTEPYAHGALWITLLEKAYAIFKNKTYAQLTSGESGPVFRELYNVSGTKGRIDRGSFRNRDKPWVASTKGEQRQRELSGKTSGLFPRVFHGEQRKVDDWASRIGVSKIDQESIDSIETELLRRGINIELVNDVIQYLVEEGWRIFIKN